MGGNNDLSKGDLNSLYFSVALGVLQACAYLLVGSALFWPSVRQNLTRRTGRSVLLLGVHVVGFTALSLYTAVHFILEYEGYQCTYLTLGGFHGLTFFPVYNITYAFVVGPYMVDCFRTWMIYKYSYAMRKMVVSDEAFQKDPFVRYIYLAKGKWNVLWLSLLAVLPFAMSAIAGGVHDTCEFVWWVHIFPFIVYITGFVYVAIKLRKIVDGFGLRREYVITGVTFIIAFLLTFIWTTLGKNSGGYAYHIHNRFWIYLVTLVGGFLRIIWPIWKTVSWRNKNGSYSASASSRETDYSELSRKAHASGTGTGVEESGVVEEPVADGTRGPSNAKIEDLEWVEHRLDSPKVRERMDSYFRMKLLTAHMVLYEKLLEQQGKIDEGDIPASSALWYILNRFILPDSYGEVQIFDTAKTSDREVWDALMQFNDLFTSVIDEDQAKAIDITWDKPRVLSFFHEIKQALLKSLQDVMRNERDRTLLVGLTVSDKVELTLISKQPSVADLKVDIKVERGSLNDSAATGKPGQAAAQNSPTMTVAQNDTGSMVEVIVESSESSHDD